MHVPYKLWPESAKLRTAERRGETAGQFAWHHEQREINVNAGHDLQFTSPGQGRGGANRICKVSGGESIWRTEVWLLTVERLEEKQKRSYRGIEREYGYPSNSAYSQVEGYHLE